MTVIVSQPPLALTEALSLVPKAEGKQSMKDFKSDQEVRWCPGCGDYAILAAVQGFMPELGLAKENIVFVSGIGASSRFPYYMNTYGMHSIHGRAPAIATGLAAARRDLSVWEVTGDGDAPSIGGNQPVHALRRNVNLKILLFNNRIYGLTKGQYSPTSEVGKITKSTPMGSLDAPFNPISLALGAEAGFVARTVDSHRKHLTQGLREARAPPGRAPRAAPRGPRAPGHRAGGDLQELQHLQRRRLRRAQGQGAGRGGRDPAGARPADPLRRRWRQGRRTEPGHRRSGGRRGHRGERGPDPGPRRPRGLPDHRLRAVPAGPPGHPPPHTPPPPWSGRARAPSPHCSRGTTPGPSSAEPHAHISHGRGQAGVYAPGL